MGNASKVQRNQVKNTKDLTEMLKHLVRLSDSNGVLANQMQELAGVQHSLLQAVGDSQAYVQEAIPTFLGALDEFDARLKVLEEKLGVEPPVLDNEGDTS